MGRRPGGLLALLALPSLAAAPALLILICAQTPAAAQLPFGEQRYEYELSDVLPEASEFVRIDGYWRGLATDGQTLGYVVLSDDLVEVPGYSGQTINTLIGLDTEGSLTGIKIVRHTEPIVLIGLSEATIHAFIDQYPGKKITDRILLSDDPKPGYVTVDGISGATVTAVAENATILEAGRLVARAEGIVRAADIRRKRPSERFQVLSWHELESRGAIGSVSVPASRQGLEGPALAIDIRFAVLDPPSVGRNLLGERFYALVRQRLDREGGSALYIGGRGELSFKGAGFARGGIFDRFLLEQVGDLFVFQDVDYINLPVLEAEGAPGFREGGIFFLDQEFDPAGAFSFRLTVPYRLADERTYTTFLADYQLPEPFVEGEVAFWRTRWQAAVPQVVVLVVLITATALAFSLRWRLVGHRKLLHVTVAAIAALIVGLWFKAQPSTTQILTLTGSVSEGRFPLEVFLSEPLLFIFWITIVVTLVVWGRGFFCGWLCPYGALLELLIEIWGKVTPEAVRRRIESWEPGAAWRYGKYVTFLLILAVSFFSLPVAEVMGEVEPFKTFVLHLKRPTAFVAYFLVITALSMASHRFFCRFLCPLGGALAIPSHRPLLRLRRYELCRECQVCARGCEPRAISLATGRIGYRECLQCWDCQNTARDPSLCPALMRAEKEGRPPRMWVGPLLVTLLLSTLPSKAATWTATAEGPTVTELIDRAADGDTIFVEAGWYRESLVVDRPLHIRGAEGAVLDAGGSGHVVVVDSPDVILEGLTLRGCGEDLETSDAAIRVEQASSGARLQRNTIEACRFGIWIHGAEDVRIVGNHIAGIKELSQQKKGDCIHLWSARGASIRDNVLSDCRDGIYMELSSAGEVVGNSIHRSRYSVHTMWCDHSIYHDNVAAGNLVGLALMFSTSIEAHGNILHDNATHGMLLVQVTRSSARDNTIIGNTKGVFVYNSLYNTLRGNLVAQNNLALHYWGGSEENEITENAFVGNEIQVRFIAARDQTWPGNFWSDYDGWDVDGDGRGEAPYRSNTLIDGLLFKYPAAKLLLTSPVFQILAFVEREFPVITVPKALDPAPLMAPPMADWASLLERYPPHPADYFGDLRKLPHIPGESP